MQFATEPWYDDKWLAERTWIVWYKRSKTGDVGLVCDIKAEESFRTASTNVMGYRKRSRFTEQESLAFLTFETQPSGSCPQHQATIEYPILQFWTLAVYFRVSNLDVFTGEAELLDNKNYPCGKICINSIEEKPFLEKEGGLEIIVLSAASSARPVPGKPSQWPEFHVLLLEWSKGIAERRGSGTIMRQAIERSLPPGPMWKEILLA